MSWGLVVLLAFLVSASTLTWYRRRSHSRFPPVDDALRARLGDPLADWLVVTRELRGQLLDFEAEMRQALVQEEHQRLPSGHRPSFRDLDDTNLLYPLREVRECGQRWLAAAAAVPEAERRRVDPDLDLDALAELLALPWAYETETERPRDRSPEYRDLWARCSEAGKILAALDAAVAGPASDPYR